MLASLAVQPYYEIGHSKLRGQAMPEIYRFPIMMAASVVIMFLILWLVTRAKTPAPTIQSVFLVSLIISVGGMGIAKYGANFGLPWTVYYTVPAILTIFLPTVLFRMSLRQAGLYILLAFLSAPAIHYVFFYAFGWNEYMPFLSGLLG